ncbi:MAG: Uma2 family endonuclease [Planctomycetes bacterium]|nr:Uma2 family endonuclease [Planctomycetota bacterium]
MTTIVFQPEDLRVPGDLSDLGRFRQWTHSTAFPESGRVDWLDGEVEIDRSPEDLNTHATPKTAVARDLGLLVELSDRGVVLTDSFRWSSPRANLSAEPDVLVVLFSTLESGTACLVEKKRRKGRFIEVEGAVDIALNASAIRRSRRTWSDFLGSITRPALASTGSPTPARAGSSSRSSCAVRAASGSSRRTDAASSPPASSPPRSGS